MKQILKKIKFIKEWYNRFRISSIHKAIIQQNLDGYLGTITGLNADITDHYGSFKIDTDYIARKVRALHAFQIKLIGIGINTESSIQEKIVDLGDSSGQHLFYTRRAVIGTQSPRWYDVGVNIDENAIKKITEKGFRAVKYNIEKGDFKDSNFKDADYVYMFETLEHLNNPGTVLKKIKEDINPKALIITVPHVRKSRVGIEKTSKGKEGDLTPEDIHIFELSPKDWKQLFTYAGWKVDYEQIYYQYPQNRITKYFWRWYWNRFDYEGFGGYILN